MPQTFLDAVRLFVTLPIPSEAPHSLRGHVRDDLVALVQHRLHGILNNVGILPFAEQSGATSGRWRASWPTSWRGPGQVPSVVDTDVLRQVFRHSLKSVLSAHSPPTEVVTWMRDHTPAADGVELALRQRAHGTLRSWPGRTPRPPPEVRDARHGDAPPQGRPETQEATVQTEGLQTLEEEDMYEPPVDWEAVSSTWSPAATEGWGSAGHIDSEVDQD